MKNWRNGYEDLSPPLHHDDPRERITKIGMGGVAIAIIPGPFMVNARSSFVQERETGK